MLMLKCNFCNFFLFFVFLVVCLTAISYTFSFTCKMDIQKIPKEVASRLDIQMHGLVGLNLGKSKFTRTKNTTLQPIVVSSSWMDAWSKFLL